MRFCKTVLITAGLVLVATMIGSARADQAETPGLRIGWATVDITPAIPVSLVGFRGS